VLHYVSEYEAVHVFSAFDVAQAPRKAVHQLSQRSGFVIGEFAEPDNVSFRLSHEMAEVGLAPAEQLGVTRIHQLVLVDHAAVGRRSVGMLLADEASISCAHKRAENDAVAGQKRARIGTYGAARTAGCGSRYVKANATRCGLGLRRLGSGAACWYDSHERGGAGEHEKSRL
jgi:hypothetical protein